MIHVNFSVFLCILRYIAGECWLRDMDLAHWVCELWLNPWVYCFRHALTTSPQWPGSRLHSSQGGPLLTHSHPLLPLPLSLLFSPDPLSAPPAPSFTPPSHSTSHFSQLPSISPFMLCFFLSFTTPPAFPSLCVPITLLSTESKLHASILQKQVLQSYQWRQYVFNYYTLISSSRLWKSCWHTANQQLWAQQNSFLMKDKYKGTLIMLKKL